MEYQKKIQIYVDIFTLFGLNSATKVMKKIDFSIGRVKNVVNGTIST
jgi:hypothetical protein